MEEINRKTKIVSLQNELAGVAGEIKTIESQISELLTQQESLQIRKQKISKQLEQLVSDEKQNIAETNWDSDSFEWSEKVKSTLKTKFELDDFRPLQKETINVTLSNHDCLLIMPTGGGKSLCFQLPAVVTKGFTLVISPLISLMEDQIILLKRNNIEAIALSTSIPPKEITVILNQLVSKDCPYKLVYVTPERIAKSKRFMAKLEKAYTIGNVSRIVIDEVHCASHWGHDFRPDYKILGILKRQFPRLPVLGLTATASEKVLDDVKDMLNLDQSCIVFRASFNRPNLFYEVHHTCLQSTALVAEIAKTINSRFKLQSGIVYCFSRKDSEDVAEGLMRNGISAHCYHADLEPQMKSAVHQKWTSGVLQVVVATIAFGMGIDKPNVRFVIHFSISKSIENYYQESGRAGRDDETAWCILYFRFQDIFRQSAMVFTEKTGLKNLYNMADYCTDRSRCRRTQIGKHFAESWNSSKCQLMCDNCGNEKNVQTTEISKESRDILSILENARQQDERITPLKLIDLWMGKGKSSLRPKQITPREKEDCEIIVTKLLLQQIITEDYHFTPYNTITYILPGPKSKFIQNNQLKVDLVKGKKLSGKSNSQTKKRSIDDEVTCTSKKKKKVNSIIIDDSDTDFS